MSEVPPQQQQSPQSAPSLQPPQQQQQQQQPQQQQQKQQQPQFVNVNSNSNNSTVLNGPNGELTMAFKEALHSENVNKGFIPQQRPQLQRLDSRPTLPAQQQQFRPGPGSGPGPQFRPRFPINPNQQPGQPLFRPQQRFVAVNPPSGGVRPNFQGPPPQQLQQQRPLQRPPIRQPPPLQPQQSFPLPPPPKDESTKLVRSVTIDQPPISITTTKPVEENGVKSNVTETKVEKQDTMEVVDLITTKMEETKVEDRNLPKTLNLNQNGGQISLSPSPQPETVIEVKPMKKEPVTENTNLGKPPKIPSSIKPTPSARKDGDNDSGVDESTQGNDHSSNGEHSPRKPLKSSGRLPTPTKSRSMSRGGGSRTPLRSPDSAPGTPGPQEKKKIPMNKIQVGSAPSPNLKVVKSKIGSLSNANYKPGGGNVKIEHRKIDVSNTSSRIGAKNDSYVPSGGEKKIISQKLQWSAKSKIGSLENATHKPKGGDKKIESIKLDFKDKAKPKIGSKDNLGYVPGGGDVKSYETPRRESIEESGKSQRKIIDQKISLEAKSKIGSLDNVKYRPGGGERKIFDDKDYLRQRSAGSHENQSMHSSQSSLPSQQSDAREPVSDENLNREN